MSQPFDQLALSLQSHYSRFRVSERLLFTGHSHQAWPDVAELGVAESFELAARHVDQKWQAAFERAEVLRNYLRTWYQDPGGLYCLAENTHLLLVSWLSSLNLKNKPRIVTTKGEFHSMYRQLHRLAEEGIEVVMVDPYPMDSFPARLADQLDARTSALMLSRVYYETGLVNPYLGDIAELARTKGIPLLIDDYHGTNVVPLSLSDENLLDCFVLIGGYKYLQWGEGNCFLRFPKNCQLRPVITGWFASFATLESPRDDQPTAYDTGNQRFATATYDPTSQFRAARVAEFFIDQKLTPEVLRQQYLAQLNYFREQFLAAYLDSTRIQLLHDLPLENNGGFLSFRTQLAGQLQQQLNHRGVLTDHRGDILRFGMAPYITSEQIDQALVALVDCLT